MSGLTSKTLHVPKTIKLFIGGEFPRTESGRSTACNVFGSDKVYANLCRASRKDFRNAVTAAQSGLSSWENRAPYNRGQILYRMAEMAEGKRKEFIETMVSTLGFDEVQAGKELDRAIDAFVYYSGFTDKYQALIGSVNPVTGPHHCFTSPEPMGVVGLICNQEFDLAGIVASICAIIASGNSVVALLPENGAAVIAPLAEVFATSDLPKGVVNLLTGEVAELQAQFASHMEVHAVSHQDSSQERLSEIKKLGADNMKRVIPKVAEPLSLAHLLSFVEFKTVWHPIGS